jgi:hypothetical protein
MESMRIIATGFAGKQNTPPHSLQIDRLNTAVDDTGFDRHELRILVKRTRYLTETFPETSPLSRKAASSLKALQSALGSWHDHYKWCQKVLIESDLRSLEKNWQSCAATGFLLPTSSGKKKLSEGGSSHHQPLDPFQQRAGQQLRPGQ